ncbi:MAG: replication-associated recombination protein A [Patescibacteria group bacterium]|nr:replication-associated recombination protein A [Patescibacteria group bacterium]
MNKVINTTQAPLAERMRPKNLSEFFGQQEIIGQKSFLKDAISADNVPSMIFWGPPGSGKTTLAYIISQKTNAEFVQLSAVSSGKADLTKVLGKAKDLQLFSKRTILFVDEIHRWNKAQQDYLLPFVEKGLITLIGATTENPSFEINSALLSRTRVIVLKQLIPEAIEKIVERAIKDEGNGLGSQKIKLEDGVMKLLTNLANGDARVALNTLEVCAKANNKISAKLVREIMQKQNLLYDRDGEEHYNIISALHKSMRGGDPHASVYWLARMLEGGEDPKYIARRLVRFASEDVGLADNFAVVLANSVFDACHKLGMPECNVHLTQLVIYLAKAPKNIVAYQAYGAAKKDVAQHGNLGVPMHIRNAPTKLMKNLGYGKDYKYIPVEGETDQSYFPEKLKNRKYFK